MAGVVTVEEAEGALAHGREDDPGVVLEEVGDDPTPATMPIPAHRMKLRKTVNRYRWSPVRAS